MTRQLSAMLFLMTDRILRAMMIVPLLALPARAGVSPPAAATQVLLLEVRGAIDPPVSAYVREAVARAERENAQAVLIELDTPGGLLDSTREIIQAMINSRVPIVVFTAPRGARATSAGAFLMMAADVAAMAPGTHIGAAHPVSLGGAPPRQERDGGKDAPKKDGPRDRNIMEEKAVSDSAAYIRGLAAERGRNAAWAEKAVRESVSLTAQEALEQKVVELTAADRGELLEKLEGRRVTKGGRVLTLKTSGAPVTPVEMGAFQKILHTLANPNLAYLFLMIGLYGLIYEFSSPGVGFGAVVGFVSLALAGYSLSILPVNYAGLMIVGLGIVLLILETQVVSHGLLSIGGLALLALGSLFLFDSAQPLWRVSRPLIAGTTAATAAFFSFVVFKVLEARRRPPSLGPEAFVGRIGEVRQALEPSGMVFIDGELWSAEADQPIPAGAKVVVRDVRGMLLKVDKA